MNILYYLLKFGRLDKSKKLQKIGLVAQIREIRNENKFYGRSSSKITHGKETWESVSYLRFS
jgi:hypothetical protein